MCKFWNDNPDDFQGLYAAFAQRLGQEVGAEVVLARVLFYHFAARKTYAGAVFQRPRHGGNRNTELTRNIFHRDGC